MKLERWTVGYGYMTAFYRLLILADITNGRVYATVFRPSVV